MEKQLVIITAAKTVDFETKDHTPYLQTPLEREVATPDESREMIRLNIKNPLK
ncbi:3-keto-5-aminohexanoate cleavage protein [Oceanobacillus rekensis]|uniref:3-keto-5-aminohexanoate cleavage protein n=1 Tax=Oceanobacillus rekensis TaxID=937927 RepID=UPI00112379EA|nr:3-keto-5-aminohexanoate cleavage protein [Oceanobacillus rekensis]